MLTDRDQPSEQTMDLWWRMGVDGCITFANRSFQDTLGFSSEEILSKPFSHLIHPDDQGTTRDILQRLGDEENFITHVSRFLCQDMTYRRIYWQATNAGPGGFITAIGKHLDSIQDEVQEEIVQNGNIVYESKPIVTQEKYLSLIHDLNNLIPAVLGYTQLASLKLSNEHTVQGWLHKAITIGYRAQELVLKSLESPSQNHLPAKPIELREVIEEVLVLLRATLPDTVTIQQGRILGAGKVYGDFTKIFQLVMNLCSNAVKIMKSRGGVLSIWIDQDNPIEPQKTSPRSDSYIHLSVGDTGPGMTSDTLQRIFEPYYTTHPADKGTGLGLAIVNEIITDLGGVINVESEVGKGTTFHVYFPSHNPDNTD